MLLGKVKLGEVTISNVTIPKIATVQTVSKAPRYAENGEPIQGSVSKIVCQFVDSELAKLIQKPEMQGVEVMVVGDHQPPMWGNEIEHIRPLTVAYLHFKVKATGAK